MSEARDIGDIILEKLAHDREYRIKFRHLLDLDDDYAKKSDLVPILERIDDNLTEIRKMRREFEKHTIETRENFEKVWEEMAKQREEMAKQREEMIQEMAKQREEMAKQREEMIQEMAKQREDTSDQLNKIWMEIRDIKIDLGKVHRRLDKHEEWLKHIGGSELELKSFRWFMAVLDAKGEKIDNLKWRVKFTDPEARLGTPEIEIDIFSEDPLYVVEITNYITDLKKLIRFKKKIQFIREKFGREPKAIIITNGFSDDVDEESREFCRINNFNIFDVGWRPPE